MTDLLVLAAPFVVVVTAACLVGYDHGRRTVTQAHATLSQNGDDY